MSHVSDALKQWNANLLDSELINHMSVTVDKNAQLTGYFGDPAGTAAFQNQLRDMEQRQWRTQQEREAIAAFRETYLKVRTDNIALDHHTAIELVKMIYREADTLTYQDTQ